METHDHGTGASDILSPASLFRPRLVSGVSAWNEHISFAGWVLEASDPAVFVELGTHVGVSYFAFCEAVSRLGLATKCFAVDTWEGDEHAGFYGEEVFDGVRKLNAEYYGSFSRLVRTTFDEAALQFEDGSIDLLHLDGLHTYDAVRHDFEVWLPKMSQRGVMLFHDSHERKKDFGVYRLIAELKAEYPTFEFTHEHGLAVVCIGEDVPEGIARLTQLDEPQSVEVREMYEGLGRNFSMEIEHSALTEAIGHRDTEIMKLSETLGRRDAEIARLSQAAQRLQTEVDVARRSLARLQDRRIVQVSLAAARPFKPLFRSVRRRKRQRAAPGSSSSSRSDRAGEGSARVSSVTLKDPMAVPASELLVSLDPGGEPVTIIVPVYNAPDELRACLDALFRNTTGDARLLIIDDASTDDRIDSILENLEDVDGVEVRRNEQNLGFVKTVNRGFVESSGDVVILNSDATVTPGWLDRLRFAARQVPEAGTVTPLSNNAGAFSAPTIAVDNETPIGLTIDEIGRLVAHHSGRSYPRTPTGNGYCMYIRRACIDDVGLFDAEAFPRGYGEENDFCMRAAAMGWSSIVDDATYVFHERSASFGSEKELLMVDGRRVLDRRYPEYGSLVRSFVSSPEMVAARKRVGDAFGVAASCADRPRPRVLFVLHGAKGGTPATTMDLARGLDATYESFILVSNGVVISLLRMDGDKPSTIDEWKLNQPVTVVEKTNPEYREIVQSVLLDYTIEIVHIRHLIGHTFELPAIAKDLGIPVVLSFHDFYYICPTVHLMDDRDRFCGGTCSPGQGICPVPTEWLEGLPHLKHGWVHDWRRRAVDLFRDVDAFVTSSDVVKHAYENAFPGLEAAPITVIPHGRDLAVASSPVGVEPEPGGPVRILLMGNIDVHKGSRFVRSLLDLDVENRLEFHVLGRPGEDLDGIVTTHGVYERSDFEFRARGIQPAFVGIFSTTAESFSHVLTEAWAAGIPVLVSNLGALNERVRRYGGGWVVDIDDPPGALEKILEVATDAEAYRSQRLAALVAARTASSLEHMAFNYSKIYGKLLLERRSFPSIEGTVSSGSELVRVGVFLPGPVDGPGTPSSHIRVLRRLLDPGLANRIVWTRIGVTEFLQDRGNVPRIDVALVQRTAVESGQVESFIAKCESEDVGIVFDIDDNLLSDDPDWAERRHYESFRRAIEMLMSNAETVMVSTASLAETLQPNAHDMTVLENGLDRHLWLGPIPPSTNETVLDVLSGRSPGLRLLYVGGPSHAADLRLLRDAIDVVAGQLEEDVELFVVGGAPPQEHQGWYTSIEIPPGCRTYPDFVAWVRTFSSFFDIAVAPLEETRLNESKSDLRFLEYALLQVPGIYSRGPAFSTIDDGLTGLIVENSASAWASAIVRLWQDDGLRSRIRSDAFRFVVDHRLVDGQTDVLVDILLSAKQRSGDSA